ncbi:virion protein [Shewanella corallii]|uniref:Virion protein n=1 Tax=Shewanella corallii TaxID=560080 RepID=A0ABT0NC65_9GAMM|nr:virion protein [Shewanella corallii]MCL2916077.1 virion protein [Shewanella corallii]
MKCKQTGSKSFRSNSRRKDIPRGIRNHNPLNIEKGCNWEGACGTDGRFVVFSSAFFGIRAAARTMNTYRLKYGINTIRGIVERWAPREDNNPTESYIQYVAGQAGISANTPLSQDDYPKVIKAMIRFENGQCPYSSDELVGAVNAGLA